MSNQNERPTFGMRLTDTIDDLSAAAETQREWLHHLEARLDAFDDDIKSRISEIRDRHRRVRQEISNELHALVEELGYLPVPSYSHAAIGEWRPRTVGPQADPAAIAYVDQMNGDADVATTYAGRAAGARDRSN